MDDKDKKDARLEGDEPEKKDDTPGDAGTEPIGKCASCGSANEDNAKFCDQCGASMAAPRADDDEAPPSSKKPGATALVEPKRVSVEGSLAAILGATSESLPALKTRAIEFRHVVDTCAAVFGTSKPGEIVGQLLTVPERLDAGKKAIAAQAKHKVTSEKTERWELAKRLNALGLDGRPRSSIFKDRIDDATGKRTAVELQPEYALIDLDVFRGLVASLEGGAARKPRDPFQPSRENAAAAARAADPRTPPAASASAETVISWAKSQPAFANIRRQTPQSVTDEQIARQLATTMQPHGGVQ